MLLISSAFPDSWKSDKVVPVAKNFLSKTCAEYHSIIFLIKSSNADGHYCLNSVWTKGLDNKLQFL